VGSLEIIYDTDPGIDDTMALLLALRSPEIRLLGITTVFGNADVEKCTANAINVLRMANRTDIPVIRGASAPLVRPYGGAVPHVHGEDGLGNLNLPQPDIGPISGHAAKFIVDTVAHRPGRVTLVAVGPLTNLALALHLEPRLPSMVRQVIIMGGAAFAPGNVSPVAEANIHNDPEAAHLVMTAGWPLVMVGLDVTTKVLMTREYLERLAGSSDPFGRFIGKIVPVYLEFHRATYGIDAIHTHDPSAVAYAIDPGLFRTERYPVVVACEGPATGQVIVDRERRFYRTPPISLCLEVDSRQLLELYSRRITGQD
jgi:uridine nucleosidase